MHLTVTVTMTATVPDYLECGGRGGVCARGDCHGACRNNNNNNTCLKGCGHGTCSTPPFCVCDPGWTGPHCDTPICSPGCHQTHGSCQQPGECRCGVGWWGPGCHQCFPYPECDHGTCSQPWECNCHDGWTGLLCDTPEKGVAVESKFVRKTEIKSRVGVGDTSKDTREVIQSVPEPKDQCKQDRNPCLNGGTCRNSTCLCPPMFVGQHCDYLAPRPTHLSRRGPRTHGDTGTGGQESRRVGTRRGPEEKRMAVRRNDKTIQQDNNQADKGRQEEITGEEQERNTRRRSEERTREGGQGEGKIQRQENQTNRSEGDQHERKEGEQRNGKVIDAIFQRAINTEERILVSQISERNLEINPDESVIRREELDLKTQEKQEEDDWKSERRRLLQKHARISFRQPKQGGSGQDGDVDSAGNPFPLIERQLLPLPVVLPRAGSSVQSHSSLTTSTLGVDLTDIYGQGGTVVGGALDEGYARGSVFPSQDSATNNLIRRQHNRQDSNRPRLVQVINSQRRPILVSAHSRAIPTQHPLSTKRTSSVDEPSDSSNSTNKSILSSPSNSNYKNGSVSVQSSSSVAVHSHKVEHTSVGSITTQKEQATIQSPTRPTPSTPSPPQNLLGQPIISQSTPAYRMNPIIPDTTVSPRNRNNVTIRPFHRNIPISTSQDTANAAHRSSPIPFLNKRPPAPVYRPNPTLRNRPNPQIHHSSLTPAQRNNPTQYLTHNPSSLALTPVPTHKSSLNPFLPTPARPTPNPRPIVPSVPTPTPTPTPVLWSRVDRTVWPNLQGGAGVQREARVDTFRPRFNFGRHFDRFGTGQNSRGDENGRQEPWQESFFNLGNRPETGRFGTGAEGRVVTRGHGSRVELGGQGAWQGTYLPQASSNRGQVEQSDWIGLSSPSDRVLTVQRAREDISLGDRLETEVQGVRYNVGQGGGFQAGLDEVQGDRYDGRQEGRGGMLDTKNYYQENEGGRVHIGDISRVDDKAPHRAIFDAFIELKKV